MQKILIGSRKKKRKRRGLHRTYNTSGAINEKCINQTQNIIYSDANITRFKTD